MLKIACAICICLFALPALCEPQAKYELATIVEVKPYQPAGDSESQSPSYAISVKVGDVIYVVLYKNTLFTPAVQYAGGRQLLVHIGKETITYNDILGRSQTVPIVSRKPAKSSKESK